MSFTTCRDGDNLHECTTHINADGIKETVTLRYECCYGYTRDQSGPGCVQTAMTDMRTAMQEMEQLNLSSFLSQPRWMISWTKMSPCSLLLMMLLKISAMTYKD